MKSKILVIVGPTASGKSSLAIEIAQKFSGEILCVDSRTVYRGMDIGTAKPPPDPLLPPSPSYGGLSRKEGVDSLSPYEGEGRGGVKHHGLDLINPNEEMNGALFKEYADKVIADILSRGHLPILCGGTGLWLEMIVDNLEMPEVEPDLVLRAELEKRSTEDLFAEFSKLDPVGAEVIDQKNKRRLLRALEVCQKTGQPFSELRKRGESKYDALWIGIDWPKNILDERINTRVDEMIENGLVDEVKNLKEKYGCDSYAMSGIGYREICEYFRRGERFTPRSPSEGGPLAPDAIIEITEQIKNHTRQYAKRQRTWFKRNKNIRWVTDIESARGLVNDWLVLFV